MREPALAAEIVGCGGRGGRRRSGDGEVPFRVGLESVNAPEFAQAMQAAGAAAVAVHGRTRGQFYKGSADWDVIARGEGRRSACRSSAAATCSRQTTSWRCSSAPAWTRSWSRAGRKATRGSSERPQRCWRPASVSHRPRRSSASTWRASTPRRWSTFGGEQAFARMRKHVAWYIAEMPGATYVRARAYACQELDRARRAARRVPRVPEARVPRGALRRAGPRDGRGLERR